MLCPLLTEKLEIITSTAQEPAPLMVQRKAVVFIHLHEQHQQSFAIQTVTFSRADRAHPSKTKPLSACVTTARVLGERWQGADAAACSLDPSDKCVARKYNQGPETQVGWNEVLYQAGMGENFTGRQQTMRVPSSQTFYWVFP